MPLTSAQHEKFARETFEAILNGVREADDNVSWEIVRHCFDVMVLALDKRQNDIDAQKAKQN